MPKAPRPPKAFVLILLSILLSTQAVLAESRCSEDETCRFGVFPHAGARQLQNTYAPIAEDLSLILDRPVRLITGASMRRFHEMTSEGAWDIALIGPGQIVTGAKPAGYIPVAKPAHRLTYEIVTLPRTGITRPEQLRGKHLGVMTETTGTNLMTRKLLFDVGLKIGRDLRATTYPSEHACLHAMLISVVDACGMASPILRVLREQKPADYVRVAVSEAHPSSSYVVHPGLSAEDREAVTDYLLSRPNMVSAAFSDYESYRLGWEQLGTTNQ